MFRLLHYFSIASLLSIVAASIGLSAFYSWAAKEDILRFEEMNSVDLTRIVANKFEDVWKPLLRAAPALSDEQLRADPRTEALHVAIGAAVAGTSVVKVKLFSLDGRTVYSSDPRQTGENKRTHGGFAAAKAGRTVSEITQRDHVSAFDNELANRGVLSSFTPLRARGSEEIVAVFELYQDVTPLLSRIEATERTVVAGVLAVLLLLYGILFLIVLRADRILRRQDAQGRVASEQLQNASDELGRRAMNLAFEEARTSAILNAAHDCILTADAQGVVTEFNPAAERTFGLRRADALGRPLADLILPPEHRQAYIERARRLIASGTPRRLGKRFEMTAQRQDGSRFQAEVAISDVRVGDKLFLALYLSDISDRLREDTRLREVQARNRVLATMVEQSTDAIHARDLDGNITYWNQGAERLSGYRAAEAIGQPLRSLHLSGRTEQELAKIRARIRAGDRAEFEDQRANKTGQWTDVSVRTAPLFDDDGRLNGQVSVLRDVTAAKAAERTLRDSETRNREHAAFLQTLLDELPVGVSLVDKNLRVVVFNEAKLRLLDLPAELARPGASLESIFRHYADRGVYGPGDRQALVAERIALARQPKPHRFEREQPDGRVLETRGIVLPDGGLVTIVIDITERKMAELALRESALKSREHAEFLQALLDALPVGVSLTDRHLNVAVANQASLQLLDLPAEVFGRGAALENVFRYNAARGEYGPGDSQALVAQRLALAQQPRAHRFERQRPDGTAIEVRGVPLADGSMVTTYTDVTERHRAVAVLRESERRNREHAEFLQALLDALPVGVALVDRDLNFVVANDASVKLQRLPDGFLKPGSSMQNLFRYHAERGVYGPGDVASLVAARMARARDPAPHRAERELADGSALEVRAMQMPDGSRVTTFTDITERKLAERELRVAKDAAEAGSQAKSAFLAVMSHEIRTPMNAVIGLLELLRLSPLDAEQQETVDTVRESSKSLLRLIDDVLDFSKIEAGKLELMEEPASLAQMFESAYQTFSGVASQKGVLLEQRVDPLIANALVLDRLRLRQIVNNFLSNAIKFTADRGRVELRADLLDRHEHCDRVRISVRDTGVGIDARALERLFEPFSQADAAIERRYGGTGLGLAICKRLAALMGAPIEVQSAPGAGTTFGLTLTLRRADDTELRLVQPMAIESIARAVQGRGAPTVDAARADGRLVLVVDDHPINRRMLARQMNALGYAVQTAEDGREALEQLRRGGFGLVITDCQMPVMDGYQLASAIRRAEAGAELRLPIVACTANVSHESLDECRSVGMDDAITKPVELATLKQVLDRWLPAAMVIEAEEAPPAPIETDFAALEDLAQGDAELQRDLLDDFRKANADDLKAAARAVDTVSIDGVRRAAHRIKGAARMVGAARLANAAARLEEAAQAGDWQRVSSSWAPLQHESIRLDERIARNKSENSA